MALYRGQDLLAWRTTDEDRAHSRMLALFVDEVLTDAGVAPGQLGAVAYSKGPGSYTGLRVGLAAAKGLAYAADIPLVGIPTLDIIRVQAEARSAAASFICMQDARRMEAYTQSFLRGGKALDELSATILDEAWAQKMYERLDTPIAVTGTKATKCRDLWEPYDDVEVFDVRPEAKFMIRAALRAIEAQDFENILLATPEYLKAPHITSSRRKSL